MSEQELTTQSVEETPAAVQPPGTETPEVEGTAPEEKPVRTYTQEDLDRVVRRRVYKAQRQIGQLQGRLAELEARVPQSNPDAEPQREQFEDYEAYVKAIARHEAVRSLETLDQEEAARVIQSSQERARDIILERFEQRADQAREKYTDFDAVVNAEDVHLTPVMTETIVEAEEGAEIAYYLGQHPEEAQKIARLAAGAQRLALAKIAINLSQPKTRQSSAPAPIKPVGGTNAPARWDSDSASFEQFRAGLNKALYGR